MQSQLSSKSPIFHFQSAYRKFHSVESALLTVNNDIIKSIDKCRVIALALSNLSAAFDTVGQSLFSFPSPSALVWNFRSCTELVCYISLSANLIVIAVLLLFVQLFAIMWRPSGFDALPSVGNSLCTPHQWVKFMAINAIIHWEFISTPMTHRVTFRLIVSLVIHLCSCCSLHFSGEHFLEGG